MAENLSPPRFVTEVRRGDEVVQKYPTVVLRERMCKPDVLRNIQICLEGVVGKNTGTGKLAYSKYFAVAGKTGYGTDLEQRRLCLQLPRELRRIFPCRSPTIFDDCLHREGCPSVWGYPLLSRCLKRWQKV